MYTRIRRNLISSPRYYFSVAAKQYLEDVSASVAFQFACLWEKRREGEEGGGRNAWKEGSVLLPRRRGKKGEAHTRNGFFSPHPPREIIDSQRGNDVVNTTSVAHPLEPTRFFSPTLPPFCYQAPPSCAASSSRNPPLFPLSRLRLCPSCVYNPRSAINSTHPLFFFCANSFLYFIYFSR